MLRLVMVLSTAGLMSLSCLAQNDASASAKKLPSPQATETASKNFYRLKFLVQELENDRVINSRSYLIVMREMGQGSIRAGEKVPFSSTSGATTQWQQIDIGVSIDCRGLIATADGVSLDLKAEISSVMESSGPNSPPPALPIIRSNQWEATVVLPVKQPSIVFLSDDPASKRTMQVQLTVTPIRQ